MPMDRIKQIFAYSPDSPLYFTRLYFWVFFIIVLFIFSFVYKKRSLRNGYLLLISVFFYYKSGGIFFILLLISTLVDFTAGNLIYKSSSRVKRKWYVVLSILANLGMLSYYKYAYFFTDIINKIFNTHLQAFDVLAKLANDISGSNMDITTIILPVGISFFTFQTLSYTIDIYRGKTQPLKSIVDFAFYVSFFPQLVAGPIVRASEFVPQLLKEYQLSKEELGQALFLILQGLIKKIIISDYISTNFIDRVFQDPLSYSGFENLMGLYGYSMQIYCDFSGYTDIAIGVGLLLGFRLPLNFNSPYKAVNLSDFWRRWHISLSTWLRDYLYIPLGGNRKGKLRANINLMITMLLGGLWHGANLRFVIWGGIHGMGLVFQKIRYKILPQLSEENKVFRFISIFFTFHVVTFAWLFFRAKDMHTISLFIKQITNHFQFSLIHDFIGGYYKIFGLMLFGYIFHWLPAWVKEYYRGLFIKTPVVVKGIIVIFVVILLYQFTTANPQPFIYFQF